MNDFTKRVKELSQKIELYKDDLETEAATKAALIVPFIQYVLGYDVSNPKEVVPEIVADIGIKKGEKVDYGIKIDNKPLILIEAKHITSDLDKEIDQLYRYYTSVKDAKFGILTNGIVYKFFTDLENKNIMDTKPFLEIDLLNLKDEDIKELYLFNKNIFDKDKIINNCKEKAFKNLLIYKTKIQLVNPSDEFINLLVKDLDLNQDELDKSKSIVKGYLKTILTKSGIVKKPQMVTTDSGNTNIKQLTTNNIVRINNKQMTLNDTLTGYKPISLTIDNTKIEEPSWIKVLIKVCIYLGQNDLNRFSKLQQITTGTKCSIISKTTKGMRNPIYVKELKMYIERNISTEYMISTLRKVLRFYNKDINKIKLEVREGK